MTLCAFCEENETQSGYTDMCAECEAYCDDAYHTCPICGDKAYCLGLCRQHFAEDEEIRKENERNRPRSLTYAEELAIRYDR